MRKLLESAAYPDLGAMMEGYANAAVELSAGGFGHKLDFSSESVLSLIHI